jgi:organic hydroperoxide reductase OsmC/OhrA
MKRFGSATWNGGLREGRGSVSTEGHALETYPSTFFSRYGEKPGTNPEELLGASHAACFHHVVSSGSSARRTSCQSKSTANRRSSSKRTAMAFPSPQSISPSLPRYRASARPRSN